MKLVVNNQENLIVKDQEGNILFQWLPVRYTGGFVTHDITVNSHSDSNEISKELINKLKEHAAIIHP